MGRKSGNWRIGEIIINSRVYKNRRERERGARGLIRGMLNVSRAKWQGSFARYYSAVNGDNLVFYFLSTATEKYELLLITAASVLHG